MSFFSKCVRFTGEIGLYQLARLLTRRQPKLLMYHHFSNSGDKVNTGVDSFEQQLQYIKKYYRPVTVSQLASEYYQSNKAQPNSIAITVDDGYLDFYEYAFPLLKKYNIPATFYVATGFVSGKQWLWTDQLHWLFETMGDARPEVKLENFYMPAASDYNCDWQQCSYQLNGHLLTLPEAEKWEIIYQLASDWQLEIPSLAVGPYRACTLQQLAEMQAFGIEIGGHTVSHPSLGRVSSGRARDEIKGCYTYLQENLGDLKRSFCYPNGTKEDYTKEVKSISDSAGFSCAVTAFSDVHAMEDRWEIRRSCGGDNLFQFYKAISGVEWLGYKIRSVLRRIRS